MNRQERPTLIEVLIPTAFMAGLFFVAALLGCLIALAAGYLLNAIASIGLLQGSLLFLATVATAILGVGFTFANHHLKKRSWEEEFWFDEDDENDDDNEPKERPTPSSSASTAPHSSIQLARVTVGRNQPCPCGSGKKYKNCCRNHPNSPDHEQDAIPF